MAAQNLSLSIGVLAQREQMCMQVKYPQHNSLSLFAVREGHKRRHNLYADDKTFTERRQR